MVKQAAVGICEKAGDRLLDQLPRVEKPMSFKDDVLLVGDSHVASSLR